MSAVLWKNLYLPSQNDKCEAVDLSLLSGQKELQVRSIPADNRTLMEHDKKSARNLSRNGCLLSKALLKGSEFIKKITDQAPYKIGFYCAVENGSLDYEAIKSLQEVSPEDFPQVYKKQRSPKAYLKQLPNLAAGQITLEYNIRGPLYVFTHSREGSKQALRKACFDLEHKKVDYALIAAAFSNEDLLNLYKNRERSSFPLSEGVGALLLAEAIDYTFKTNKTDYHFGIAH